MARIAFVIATLDRGGSEGQLVSLAARLDRSRFAPVVICLTRGGPLEGALAHAGVTTIVLHKRRKLDLACLRQLTDLLRLLRPDIVHTWLFTANAYGRWAAWRAGVPHLVASERSTDPGKPWLHRAIDRWLARRTDSIVTNCEAVRAVYRQRLDVPAARLVVIPNGLDVTPALLGEPAPPSGGQVSSSARSDFRRREGLPADALLFVTASRLEPTKAVADLLRALALTEREAATSAPRRSSSHLVVVGGGSELPHLAALAHSLGVAQRVLFLGEVADVRQVLAAADVFLFASLYEGLPNALLEAMAAGLPVVATAVGGIPEVVTEGETGYLVPIRRPDLLAQRMVTLAGDGELRGRLGAAARERMKAFGMERMVQGYEDLYGRVLAGAFTQEVKRERL
jgi:glycosyltransferase involved in cell wall biosynthesis